ncbi:MAG: hypothetical protein IKF83_01190 [Clostridia bacterium]|nr:hypothetical protein [Clostridia bacterium]
MRKTLIMLMIFLLGVIVIVMMLNSLSVGNLKILGLRDLNAKNKELDSQIQNLSSLSSTGYQKALTDVENSTKQYKTSKEEYDQLAAVSAEGQLSTASQLQKYEIEYLWTRIGTHATKENVVIKMEVSANSTSSATGYYDLNFTVTGGYVAITDFIYDIENDSSLGFKIENFKMTSGTATFSCKNISINIDPSEITSGESNEDNSSNTNSSTENTNTKSDNTTNTTNTTSNTNTTSTNTSTNTNSAGN